MKNLIAIEEFTVICGRSKIVEQYYTSILDVLTTISKGMLFRIDDNYLVPHYVPEAQYRPFFYKGEISKTLIKPFDLKPYYHLGADILLNTGERKKLIHLTPQDKIKGIFCENFCIEFKKTIRKKFSEINITEELPGKIEVTKIIENKFSLNLTNTVISKRPLFITNDFLVTKENTLIEVRKDNSIQLQYKYSGDSITKQLYVVRLNIIREN